MQYDLSRFISAHQTSYNEALSEIKNGRKTSHWMWYVFPQLKGLGRSSTSEYYGIADLDEARAFLADEYLGANLIEISQALLDLNCDDARLVLGTPDNMKLKSSMTLFALAKPEEPLFHQVLNKFFCGKMDNVTLKYLGY